jgi:DNA-binding GntR family transcriptional regulator
MYSDVMSINADDPRVPRVQIADILRAEIRNVRPPASRLPSVRDFATRFGVSTGTAQAAVDILKAEGLVVTHGNRGMFTREAVGQVPGGDAAVGSET